MSQYVSELRPEAITAACEALWGGPEAFAARDARWGVLALVADADRASIGALQAFARTHDVVLVGAVVPALVTPTAVERRGALLVRFDASRPHRLLAWDALTPFVDEVERVADPDGHDTLLLLVDLQVPDIVGKLDALYEQLGDLVHYVGFCVGSETFQPIPCLFDRVEVRQGGALALLLEDAGPGVLAHGYGEGRALWVATATEGNRVGSIDGRRAFDVYQDLVQREFGVALDRETFYQYGVHFALAVHRAQGEPLVRIPVGLDEDGSVQCSGDIRENAFLSLVRAVSPGDTTTAVRIGREARARCRPGDRPAYPEALLFYCAGRYLHLGDASAAIELTALRHELGDTSSFGALCLGEIGSGAHDYPAYHNAAIGVVPWP